MIFKSLINAYKIIYIHLHLLVLLLLIARVFAVLSILYYVKFFVVTIVEFVDRLHILDILFLG